MYCRFIIGFLIYLCSEDISLNLQIICVKSASIIGKKRIYLKINENLLDF